MTSDNKNNKAHDNENIQQIHSTSGYIVKEGYGADFLRFINANQLKSKEAMEKARQFAKQNKVEPK
jgi:hypothetical protein